ncbi:MAG: formyltransferase family protein, partial [Planctomycetota bacterium]|nr:formyltransferase family protein [Planctomycetota bacterium]
MNTSGERRIRLAVLLSGSGTTLENIFERIERGELGAEVAAVVSSRRDAYGLVRAAKRGVPSEVVPGKKFATVEEFSGRIFDFVRRHRPDLVCLAGFMCLIKVPEDFRWR